MMWTPDDDQILYVTTSTVDLVKINFKSDPRSIHILLLSHKDSENVLLHTVESSTNSLTQSMSTDD